MQLQSFKNGDLVEQNFFEVGRPIIENESTSKSTFFDQAYSCFVLGELMWDNKLAPLTNAMPRAVFRTSFATVFNNFITAGTFESYIAVFKNIFGADTDIQFGVTAPGKLSINIHASSLNESFMASNLGDDILDEAGENILCQTIDGFATQYAVTQMLTELIPDGIVPTISLTIEDDLITEASEEIIDELGENISDERTG